jgi:hypothetical protein
MRFDFVCTRGDNPTMTVVADAKKRVVLPVIQAGDRFDVQLSEDGKVILTPLVMAEKPDNIRLVKKRGYTVAVGTRLIHQEQVRKLIDEFP